MRLDWVPHVLIVLAVFGGLYFLARIASRAWGERWSALRRRPLWLQGTLALVLLWLALRVARLGWRALLVYLAAIVGLALWGELAAYDLRRAASKAGRTR
ncbi:MAG TPA: hypothetical protein VMT92_04120 [Steroidobacteraceae bacterium]|nr:hypothetical protein [Steroidobacteraceae bacterium]